MAQLSAVRRQAHIYTAILNPSLRDRSYFFFLKCLTMLVRFPLSGRRHRKWVSVTLLTSYRHSTVHEVYRLPVIKGEILYHRWWLHKVIPAL